MSPKALTAIRHALLMLLVMVEKTVSYLVTGPHIADVNILLPPKMTNPVEYRLQGSDGCFKWSWDHHDIISVLPEYNTTSRCSTSARVKSIAPYSGRKETAIYATDIHTGIIIRCKVFVDIFSRIQIFHNSIKLDLDGLATLRVHAFDNEGNVFTSLVGLQFLWQLEPETNGLPHQLVHVPLKDSPLSDCGGLCGDLDIQIKLEEEGVFSDLFVVKGVGIGHEVVSVLSLEPDLRQMADRITLTVAEAMSVEPPSPVIVLIGAIIKYSLKVIRGNSPQEVPLPSPHHRWSIQNSSVAHVDPMMGVTHAMSLGITTVIVEDTRVSGHVQGSSLHVVIPETIRLYILPLSTSGEPIEGMDAVPSVARWYVVSERQYLIQIRVFSHGIGAQEIYITENDEVTLYDNQCDNWKLSLVTPDVIAKYGWHNSRILRAGAVGLGKLTASLAYFSGNQETREILKVVQEVMVCEKVKISLDKGNDTSQRIMLPWAPAVYQEAQLKVTGGCTTAPNDFKWFSSDMATVSVSTSGIIQARKPGKASIRVSSVFDSFNYDEVIVEVSLPSSMIMLQNFPVEAAVGSHLKAAVTLKASNGLYFYRCDAFNSFVKWKSGSEFFAINASGDVPISDVVENVGVPAIYGSPCSWTYIYMASPGQAMLHATLLQEYYQFDHLSHGPVVLKASSRIGAYPPLIMSQAGDGNQFGGYWFDLHQLGDSDQVESLDKIYLAPGSHLDVMLLGGPDRWDSSVDFIETVESLNKDDAYLKERVLVQRLSTNRKSLYRVSCQMLGTSEFVFKRGNLVGVDHPLPAIEDVSLTVACSFPSSIVVIADEPVNARDIIRSAMQAERSSGRIRATPVTVSNGHTIRLAAVGIASSGEAFANSSSLHLGWEMSNCEDLAYWDDNYPGGQHSGWERFLVLKNESGLCSVRATVVASGKIMGPHNSASYLEISEDALTDAVRIQLVSVLRVHPEHKLIFFNPNAKVNLSISGGSCVLEAAVNDTQVVEVIQPPSGLQCLELILSPRGLGTALVTVNDVGLVPPLAASSLVQVADLDWIKIISGEEISLMEGSSQSLELKAGTSDGGGFDSSQFAFMNITVHIEDDVVELVDNYEISSHDGVNVKAPRLKIVAKRLGVTNLYVTARRGSGQETLSQLIKIEVYAPPRIHPHDIFLPPGASYGMSVKGGPAFGTHIEYASTDDRIATVHVSSGRVHAISPGNTTLIATIYVSGDIAVCQAYGTIYVAVPASALLEIQSEQLGVGRKMPIYPSFTEGELFSLYEVCQSYEWTLENEQVLGFEKAKHFHGGELGELSATAEEVQLLNDKGLNFVNVLLGRSAGRTDVAVSFSCKFDSVTYSESRLYNASVSISVVPDPPLALGVPITWILPPNYVTSNILPSSTEPSAQWDGHYHKGTVTYSILRSCANDGVKRGTISFQGDRIKTADINDIACVQAKDRSTGRTEIAACIRVAEVAQIRISEKDLIYKFVYLALGSEIELPVNYYDILGNPFYEAWSTVPLDVETNYPDIVNIGETHTPKGNILVKGLKHGSALLRVSISDSPWKSNYVLISVGPQIYPQNPVLQLGNAFDFSVKGFENKISGKWISANDSVICVDELSGKSKAVGEGMTQVFFEASNMRLQTTVSVQRSNIVVVVAPKEIITNAPSPTTGYEFTVKFRSPHSHVLEDLRNGKGVPYDCIVNPASVGYAKPWIDLEKGSCYCLFFPYSPENLFGSLPKSGETKQISFSVTATLKDVDNVSGSATALFIGGFSIMGMGKHGMQLNLTTESDKSYVTILGNTDVEFQWQAQDLISISPIRREDNGVGSWAQYEIRAHHHRSFKDKIIIFLPDNGQRMEIDVSYVAAWPVADDTHIEESSTFNHKVIGILVMLILLLVSVAVLIVTCFDKFKASITRPTSASGRFVPVTPDRSSPPVRADESPRTPQPFLEYVRRTIDETPYYGREGPRRRFNPQNTY